MVVVWILASCFPVAAVPPASPRATTVRVGKADPPPGAAEMGTIEATHGVNCGGFGERGTLEGAMVILRNMAAARNANYVSLLSTTEPHLVGGCFDNRFVLRGIAYRVDRDALAAPQPVASDGCDPPCSPGYRCSQAVCMALCNPACGDNQVCRQDRTCGPAKAPSPPAH